jgi:hypothetical protein
MYEDAVIHVCLTWFGGDLHFALFSACLPARTPRSVQEIHPLSRLDTYTHPPLHLITFHDTSSGITMSRAQPLRGVDETTPLLGCEADEFFDVSE